MTTMLPKAAAAVADLLSASARLLAGAGVEAVADVLHVGVGVLGCDELVLREPAGGRVLARAQALAVPRQRGADTRWQIDAVSRYGGDVLGVLSASSGRPFTPDRAAAVTALAELLALALAARRREEDVRARRRYAGQAVLDAEADRAQLAAALHDRVAHDLVALHYTAERVQAGALPASDLRDPARAALTAYRQAQRDVRSHALEAGLRSALAEIAARAADDRPDDGQPALRVDLSACDPALDDLPPPVAVTAERVAEALLRGATGRASVWAAVEDRTVKLRVESADIAWDASELDRWDRRVHALGGHLRTDLTGVELTLPAATEGSHDDGPHL